MKIIHRDFVTTIKTEISECSIKMLTIKLNKKFVNAIFNGFSVF